MTSQTTPIITVLIETLDQQIAATKRATYAARLELGAHDDRSPALCHIADAKGRLAQAMQTCQAIEIINRIEIEIPKGGAS